MAFGLNLLLALMKAILSYLSGSLAITATATGKKTESPTLIAEGRHRQVDVLASIVVLASITVSYLDVTINVLGLSIDRITAVLILLFIVRAGWELLSSDMRVLLDASIDAETLYRIRTIIDGHPKVGDIQSLIGRSAGRFRFIQGVITVKTKNLEEAQRIREEIETKIRDRVPHMEKIMIHCGPQVRTHELLALPLDGRGIRISDHFGEAPYFGFVRIGLKDKSIDRLGIVENPHRSVETAKGIRVAEWLISRDVDHVGMKEDISHRGPGYVLSNAGVQTHRTREETIDRATADIVAEIA